MLARVVHKKSKSLLMNDPRQTFQNIFLYNLLTSSVMFFVKELEQPFNNLITSRCTSCVESSSEPIKSRDSSSSCMSNSRRSKACL